MRYWTVPAAFQVELLAGEHLILLGVLSEGGTLEIKLGIALREVLVPISGASVLPESFRGWWGGVEAL